LKVCTLKSTFLQNMEEIWLKDHQFLKIFACGAKNGKLFVANSAPKKRIEMHKIFSGTRNY